MAKETKRNFHLIWLNWPIGAFRLDARSLAVYKSLARGRVEAVRSERAFLKALPEATHAVCWEFRKEWFVPFDTECFISVKWHKQGRNDTEHWLLDYNTELKT